MLRELLTGIVGLCGGMVVATALAAFIIGLGMIPRYAGVTHTGNHLLFYENSLMLGSFLGNLFLLYRIHINLDWSFYRLQLERYLEVWFSFFVKD